MLSNQGQRQNTGKLQMYHDLNHIKKPNDLESPLQQSSIILLRKITTKKFTNFKGKVIKVWYVNLEPVRKLLLAQDNIFCIKYNV